MAARRRLGRDAVVLAALCVLGARVVATADAEVTVLTNHLGYDERGPKHAVVLGHAGDVMSGFSVVDVATHKAAFSGTVKFVGPVDHWKDWVFWTVDFDAVLVEGSYVLTCKTEQGEVRSFPFQVQRDMLERTTLSNVIYYFKTQRCTGVLEEADRQLKFEDAPADGPRLDLHGGWQDATGDFGKHLSHLSFATYFCPQHGPLTTWVMLKANEELERRGGKNFWLYRRRLLDEAMYGADYLYRSKSPHGSFFRSVDDPGSPRAEERFVAKDGSGGLIAKGPNRNPLQKGDLAAISPTFAYEVGFRMGGGMAIAALAKASTAAVHGEFSSGQYLQAAREGYAFLKQYNFVYTDDGKENITDDYCILMAATELYKATHEEGYHADAIARAEAMVGRLISGGGHADYWRADTADRPFFHAADAGLPVVSLLNACDVVDSDLRGRILAVVKRSLASEIATTGEVANPFGYARQYVQVKGGQRSTTFFYPHDADTAPWWQGENGRLASLAAAARMAALHFDDDPAFQQQLAAYAANQLNWILGMNPYDCCMLHGSGRNNFYYDVGGSYAYTPAPGGIINGITSGFRDPHGIDFGLPERETGDDQGWRWAEQWLPHATWYMYAVSLGEPRTQGK